MPTKEDIVKQKADILVKDFIDFRKKVLKVNPNAEDYMAMISWVSTHVANLEFRLDNLIKELNRKM